MTKDAGEEPISSRSHTATYPSAIMNLRPKSLQKKKKQLPAIFIHAGAGFHSQQNEHIHLQTCVLAAETGMKFLRAGASATEAIEAALKVLEDKEITNAGYGSNLSIDGTVECDATVVDHFGRSGACGAVPNIKNPISLAKLILDKSSQPLSLRRVPPNILVGEGARAFAEEHGMQTYPNDTLVSKNSRARFLRWRDDLILAQEQDQEDSNTLQSSSAHLSCAPCQFSTCPATELQQQYNRDHNAAVATGTWNEGQVDSPYGGTPAPEPSTTPTRARGYFNRTPKKGQRARTPPVTSPGSVSIQPRKLISPPENVSKPDSGYQRNNVLAKTYAEAAEGIRGDLQTSTDGTSRGKKRSREGKQDESVEAKQSRRVFHDGHDDNITDTVGAVAIDINGFMAAGSSSGGIGMKHRGRLGPAALVGIGTAVVPASEHDEDDVTVAAVTSGTGEHMATTLASQRCAERLYYGNRQDGRGKMVEDEDEDAIMQSFIVNDFMGHRGVENCTSAGAIGVMAVKKCKQGIYFYFAHNTDSFALASMGGNEKAPRCVMSRLHGGGTVTTGGRKLRVE